MCKKHGTYGTFGSLACMVTFVWFLVLACALSWTERFQNIREKMEPFMEPRLFTTFYQTHNPFRFSPYLLFLYRPSIVPRNQLPGLQQPPP